MTGTVGRGPVTGTFLQLRRVLKWCLSPEDLSPVLRSPALCLLLAAGCAYLPAAPIIRAPAPLPLAQWLKAHPLPPDQNVLAVELDRTTTSSMHLVQLRQSESLHLHAHHDLMVMVQEGRGVLTLGDQRRDMTPGSVVNIPRGTPHAFRNDAPNPAVLFVVVTPPLEEPDSVPVNESSGTSPRP